MPDYIETNLDALAVGRTSTGAFIYHFETRNPTPQDVNYPIQKRWVNKLTDEIWILESYSTTNGVLTANWSKNGSGILTVESLEGNTGGPVNPDVNHVIHTIGATPYVVNGTPATNTLVWTDNGTIAYMYTANIGFAVPALNNLNIFGSQGIMTSASGSTVTAVGQPAKAAGTSSITNVGVASFFNGQFTVDVNGFVQLIGGTNPPILGLVPDAHTAPGTSPVIANGTGDVTITGGQVAAGTTANVIRTDSLAANTMTIEIQRSQATGVSTIGANGVSHFDSSNFSVDANGFVTFTGGGFFTTGTFVPVLSFGGATTGITYVTQQGEWTKFANLVFINVFILLSNKGSATGFAAVDTLPFTCVTTATSCDIYMNIANMNMSTATVNTLGEVKNGTTTILLENSFGTAPAVNSQIDDTQFLNNSQFRLQGFYTLS